ncbi:MAG: cellulase family glycosylhydrolase [Solirubrobacteraceae bacterium]
MFLALATPSRPAGDPPLLGVQVHPLWGGVSRGEAAAQIDGAAAAGAGLVRVDVGWASLEQHAKGRRSAWYLGRLDAVVGRAHERGLKVLLTVMDTPCWASSAPRGLRRGCRGRWWERGVQRYAPRDPGDYADALAFLVRRYGSRVAAWEVWNEPNQRAFFKARHPAVAYAGLLRGAYAAAKAADPDATVVGGALAGADHRFTDRLYRLGVKGSFDAWSAHPYSGDRSPLDAGAGDPEHSFVRGVPAVRKVMLRHGDDKPLWLTELGWTTSTRRDGPSWANGVDREDQARYLEQAFAQLRRWDYVRAAVWYALQDSSHDPADRVGNYGLIGAGGAPKPSRAAFERQAG